MEGRIMAVKQLLGLAYLLLIGWIVLSVAAFAGLLWMVVDVLSKLVTDDGISGGRATNFLRRVYALGLGQLEWIFFGEGEFPILP
jgi:hypothetical protein